jgi:hypothetical protein
MILVYPHPPEHDAVLPETGPRWPLSRTDTGYAIEPRGAGTTLHFAAAAERVCHLAAVTDRSETALPDGLLCAGEGSHGSEGFFARLDAARGLVWVCYLSESNPFAEVAVEGGSATVTSTSGLGVTVDLDAPVSG